MITIFSNPRPFTGVFERLQRNAIGSWLELGNNVEIVLFEDEEKTTSSIANKLGIKCINDVECNEFGTPLLHSVFEKMRAVANHEIICQVNADIILTPSFLYGVALAKKMMGQKNFFMSGRRQNLDYNEIIDFGDSSWHEKIWQKAKIEGALHGYSGMDYWMFPKHLDFNPPAFVIGRPGMDSWLVYKTLKMGYPVIDSTEVINIIHQNHPYPKKNNDYFTIEKERNIELAGGVMNGMTLREASFLLTKSGFVKPPFPRLIFSIFSLWYPWRMALAVKRKLQKK